MSKATVGLAATGTPIAAEYRRVCEGISRHIPREVTFDASLYDPAAVATAREMWRVRMAAEHESVPAFIDLARQLVEANAGLDALAVVLRMAIDEVRHTEVCGQAVHALGGDPVCEVASAGVRQATFPGCCPEERALRNVIFGNCMIEVVNTANLVDILDSMSDPYLSEATRRLLADEALHGSFGFDYLTAWSPWLDAHPEVRASIDRFLPRAFAELEQARGLVDAIPRGMNADLIALGVPDPAHLPDIFFPTVLGAIVPALEQLGFDAGTAFRVRSMAA